MVGVGAYAEIQGKLPLYLPVAGVFFAHIGKRFIDSAVYIQWQL